MLVCAPCRRLLDSAALGVVCLQAPDASVSFCSDGLAAMLGSTPAAVEGLKLEDLLCPDDAMCFQVRRAWRAACHLVCPAWCASAASALWSHLEAPHFMCVLTTQADVLPSVCNTESLSY